MINVTTSYDDSLEEIERTMDAAVNIARSQRDGEIPLVLAVHPDLDQLFKKVLGLPDDTELRGIAGESNVMVTEDVDGFRVILCNNHL